MNYLKIQDKSNKKIYIVAEDRVCELYPPNKKEKEVKYDILEKYSGKQLEGKHYIPIFDYFIDYSTKYKAHRIMVDDYVTNDSGTGIVHQAPFFGEDDYRVCLCNAIITKDSEIVCPVDETGRFTSEVRDFAGMYVKDADKHILKWLKDNGRLYS